MPHAYMVFLLPSNYILDEALKLYALHQMDVDIENARFHEAEEKRQ